MSLHRGMLPCLVDTLHLSTHVIPLETQAYAEKGSLLYHSRSLAKIVYCLRFCKSALTSASLSEKNNMIISILCIKKSGEPVKT